MDTYEEKYKEALERAKTLYENANGMILKKWVEQVFPELAESDDKKIREAQLDYWRSVGGKEWHGVPVQETIAWLEKQGEQKEYTFRSLPRLLDMIEPTSKAKAYCQKLIDTLVKEGYSTDAKIVGECLKIMNGDNVPMAIMDEKQGKPKWTDEDSLMIDSIVDTMKWLEGKGATNMKIDWLRSLKKKKNGGINYD